MRGTKHNARGAKSSSKGYSPKHDDRNFDVSKASNIDKSKMVENKYWSCQSRVWYTEKTKSKYKSFEDAELSFYKKHFLEEWKQQQEKHKESRHYERVKGFKEWMYDKAHCPECCYFQLGNVDEHVDKDTMVAIGKEYLRAETDYYKKHKIKCTILDAAYHGDEAVPQFHYRRVFAYDDNGIEKIGQKRCLEQSDLKLPDPSQPVGRYNNLKMTMDADLREIYLDICEKHGISVEREPLPNVRHNQSKEKVVADKERAKYQEKILAEKNEKLILEEAERIKQRRAERAERTEEEIDNLTGVTRHKKRAGKNPQGLETARRDDFSL